MNMDPITPPEETPWTIDELIRHRATCSPDVPLIAYPSEGSKYVDYTAKQLDVFAYRVAQIYSQAFKQRSSSADAIKVVGLLAPSNLDYLISAIALSKLGMTVLFLSTRISDAAYLSLLETTNCNDLLIHSTLIPKVKSLKSQRPHLNVQSVADAEIYSYPLKDGEVDTALDQRFDHAIENQNIAWIIHSSGSTGLPKPIYQTHAAALRNYANNFGLRGYITLPLYHAHGLSSVFRAIHSKKQIHLYSASVPLTGPVLLETMVKFDFEIFYGVPYALKLLSETDTGMAVMSKLKLVMFGGSSCPQELGDKLVKNGVKLISHYGTTETGQLMTSFRNERDLDWNWLRVSKTLEPFVRWEEHGSNLFELVVLEGWPSKVATNRPDGAYATKDLFEQHPTKPSAFRWTGRIDDTLVLLNGEKANPIPIEHTLRENSAVSEAVVFGTAKPQLGLFIIPSQSTKGLSDEAILHLLSPAIDAANKDSPAYSQIVTEMIRVLPRDTTYPRTDKDTVIRAAFYKQYSETMEQMYADMLRSNSGGGREMSYDELKTFLRETVQEVLKLEDISLLADDTDFFSLGLDSLQAARTHSAIVKEYDTHGQAIGQNVVFEHPNLEALASYLTTTSNGEIQVKEAPAVVMQRLLDKYSTFSPHIPTSNTTSHQAVLCTGTTGSLGAHVLTKLVQDTSIDRVYCLVRAKSADSAYLRVVSSLSQRRLYHRLSPKQRAKIQALPSDLSRENLGVERSTLELLKQRVGTVIHLAWAVNFNLGIESFEKHHIAGVYNLLQFCLSVESVEPAAFYFGSSVSAVSSTPVTASEAIDTDFNHAQGMGYARSKLVAENICAAAASATGMIARVCRIGQVIGDTMNGIWNATEAIPLMTQAAATIGALPALDEYPTWLPVDTVASCLKELTSVSPEAASRNAVFHVVNPIAFHWTRNYLPALRQSGLDFKIVPQREWIQRLRTLNPDPASNPPFKLLEFFSNKYDRDGSRPGLYFKTDLACAHSKALHAAPVLSEALVKKFVDYWRSECWANKPVASTTPLVILAGPCGTGKSMLAEALAAKFQIPQVEADMLHSTDAITKMGRGDPLGDDDRWEWLERVKRKAVGEAVGKGGVVVTCSALKKVYRDVLRGVPLDCRVVFVMLEATKEKLLERTKSREGHYMKADMVQGQLDMLEDPKEDEFDVIPVNVGGGKEEVVNDVLSIVSELVFGKT